MRQKMRVTRTISTSVEEKDWKSCCPTCVMQVLPPPPPAPGLRAPALPLPLSLGEAKVRLRRHGGNASLSSFGARALIGAGLGGAGPTRLPLSDTPFPPAKKRTEPTALETTSRTGGSAHASQGPRTKEATAGKREGQGASEAGEIFSLASNWSPGALFLCKSRAAKITGLVRVPVTAKNNQSPPQGVPGPSDRCPNRGLSVFCAVLDPSPTDPEEHESRSCRLPALWKGDHASTAEEQITQQIRRLSQLSNCHRHRSCLDDVRSLLPRVPILFPKPLPASSYPLQHPFRASDQSRVCSSPFLCSPSRLFLPGRVRPLRSHSQGVTPDTTSLSASVHTRG